MQANDRDRESSTQLKSATKAADKRTRKLERELLPEDKALAEAAALLFLRESSMLSSGSQRTNDFAA